jgi:hypothetical protein
MSIFKLDYIEAQILTFDKKYLAELYDEMVDLVRNYWPKILAKMNVKPGKRERIKIKPVLEIKFENPNIMLIAAAKDDVKIIEYGISCGLISDKIRDDFSTILWQSVFILAVTKEKINVTEYFLFNFGTEAVELFHQIIMVDFKHRTSITKFDWNIIKTTFDLGFEIGHHNACPYLVGAIEHNDFDFFQYVIKQFDINIQLFAPECVSAAIHKGSLQTLKKLENMNINIFVSDKCKSLELAVKLTKSEICEYLISKNATISNTYDLMKDIFEEDNNAAMIFLQKYFDIELEDLLSIYYLNKNREDDSKCYDVVCNLIKQIAKTATDLDVVDKILSYASEVRDYDFYKILVPKCKNQSVLNDAAICAAWNNSEAMVDLVVNKNAAGKFVANAELVFYSLKMPENILEIIFGKRNINYVEQEFYLDD